jgi:formiminoglutamase
MVRKYTLNLFNSSGFLTYKLNSQNKRVLVGQKYIITQWFYSSIDRTVANSVIIRLLLLTDGNNKHMCRLKNYERIDSDVWQGRVDDPNDPESLRWHQIVKPIDLKEIKPGTISKAKAGFCFLGWRCDEGVVRNMGRPGTAKAPFSIRKEMSNLPCRFSPETGLYDAGDIVYGDSNLDAALDGLSDAVKKILELKLFPIILGGGHEIALGNYNAIIDHIASPEKSGGQNVGIINFDAHFDLRPHKGKTSSGTMFSQISDSCIKNKRVFSYFCLGIQKYANTVSLFKTADRLGIKYILARDISESSIPTILDSLDEFIHKQKYVYLTLCADAFSSAYAPGVSAPQPFGLHPEVVIRLIKHVLKSNRVICFDIAEVSPRFDHDNRTAKLAAIVIFAIINTLLGADDDAVM